MVICDTCKKKKSGNYAELDDGSVLCKSCITEKKRKAKQRKWPTSKTVKTKDPFVKLCRRLRRLNKRDWDSLDVIAFDGEGNRVYTNAHTIVSETLSVPKNPRTIALNSLEDTEVFRYAEVSKVISKVSLGYAVEVPQEFLRLLQAFNEPRPGCVVVTIARSGYSAAMVDDTMSFTYGGNIPELPFSVAFDATYLNLLKPGRIRLGKDSESMCVFESCRGEGAQDLKHVIVMPWTL